MLVSHSAVLTGLPVALLGAVASHYCSLAWLLKCYLLKIPNAIEASASVSLSLTALPCLCLLLEDMFQFWLSLAAALRLVATCKTFISVG